ncbi:MAG: transposase [Gammaproteobacteria bacterium]|nr:transposase [Gammaproteobacteria bacterium]
MPVNSNAACVEERVDGYTRRRPEDTVLYRLINKHWPRFVELADEQGGLPEFVSREFDEYLRCGLLEHGFVQLSCRQCGETLRVAFSCKRRGFCPSCVGRRMSDTAAHLLDDVLPEVMVRQWVCSLPWRLRYRMGYDRVLCKDVLGAFIDALTRSLRWRAKRQFGLKSVQDAQVGAVTVIQRADSALRLNVHFHTLALDGVYVKGADGEPHFHALDAPSTEEVAQVAAWTHAGILKRRGTDCELVDDIDPVMDEHPALASCYSASANDTQLLGLEPGSKTEKLTRPVPVPQQPQPITALAEVGGVNIHASAVIDGRDRRRLERMVRYIARPSFAHKRLKELDDGRVEYTFKRAWKNGTRAVVLSPLDFISRLCALIPPPYFHMLRYHGVLAGRANLRADIVPGREVPPDTQQPLFNSNDVPGIEPLPPTRHPWPFLLKRVFAVDIQTCPRCQGQMRVRKVVTGDEDIRRHLGNAPRAPPVVTSYAQLELDFVA